VFLIAVEQNHGKRLHLDKMWTSNELFVWSFFYSSDVKEHVHINLLIHKTW
jgi:hypothetical protein